MAISADVWAAIQPGFENIYDADNAWILWDGILIERYWSNAWKYSQNEANLKYTDYILQICDKNKISYQRWNIVSKTDSTLWWGGTISVYLARLWFETIDIWIPLIWMHSPYEITSPTDVYSLYKFLYHFLIS